jgi:uncharacterized protein
MDTQDIWTAALLVPSLVFGVVGWRATRQGRTSLGLSLRDGALLELVKGGLFSVPFFAVLLLVFWGTGLVEVDGWHGVSGEAVGLWAYFLVLFLLEEVVFRGLFMTGLGVVTSQAVAWVVVAVLVAAAYAFNPDAGVLAVVGAVVTNLLTGLIRWRTGRIWWGLGQRWVWNSLTITFGFYDSAFHLSHPVMAQHTAAADWLTGGRFGQEGGVVGIAFQLALVAGALLVARGRRGPWVVRDHGSGTVSS